MNSIEEKIALLTVRIQELASQQNVFKAKLFELVQELDLLKAQAKSESQIIHTENIQPETSVTQQPALKAADLLPPVNKPAQPLQPLQPADAGKPVTQAATVATSFSTAKKNNNLEEFLGKNLASKVGILVTVIGIFIGAKYAIEHDMISEQVRILLGYLSGAILAGIGFHLRNKYPGYSAVLVGGGLCVGYFITYIAFTYYQLFPRMVAFGIMVAVTAAIVYASMLYNRVIIAHLAQVGAYAIPFLLSNNSGNYGALFTYIAIINAGMMILSFKKDWRSLVYAAFGTTWIIFLSWFFTVNEDGRFASLSWTFLLVYFFLFYISILGYKLLRRQPFDVGDLIVLPMNAFIFYSLGMELLMIQYASPLEKGGFTLLNGLVHFGVAMLVKKLSGKSNTMYLLLIGLLITFVMISVPVAFNGEWVVLLWAAQACVLYVMGRKSGVGLFLTSSIVLISLTFLALATLYLSNSMNIGASSVNRVRLSAFLNENFLTAILVLLTFGIMAWLDRNKYRSTEKDKSGLAHAFFNVILPLFTIIGTYLVFYLEIDRGFDNIKYQLTGADGSFGPWEQEVSNTSLLMVVLYSFVFMACLVAVNHRWLKSQSMRPIVFIIFMLLLLVWAVQDLPLLNEQAVDYYQKAQSGFYFGSWNLWCRYAFLLPIAALLYFYQPAFSKEPNEKALTPVWPQLLVFILIIFLSFEYLLWTKVSGANNQYKYGLSVLWGLYALALIVYGIWKKHRGLRLTAMAMLVITLIKLAFFDLAHANTLTRTITYIALGGILLLVSYLYNRYKELLFGKDES